MTSGDLVHPSARSRRYWLWGVAIFAMVMAAIVWSAYSRVLAYELLSTAPDAISSDGRLDRYAHARAEPAWRQHCAACHGAEMQGDPARGAPNLADGEWLYGSGKVSQIEYTITYGIRSGNPKSRNLAIMPSFAHPNDEKEKLEPLSPAEIKDVAAYIFSLSGRNTNQAAVTRGGAIYADKGACYDCHAPDGRGDHEIGAPDLADKVWLYGDGSAPSVFRSIERGHAGICPAWIGRITPETIRALAVLIHDRSQTKIARTP